MSTTGRTAGRPTGPVRAEQRSDDRNVVRARVDEGVADPQAAAHVLLRACVQAVFEARNRPGSPMAFTAFDLLELDGRSVMGEAWTVRRKRLEDLLEPPPLGICLVPVTDEAPGLWDT